MCFNQSVSLQTYLIGMFGAIVLFQKNTALGAFYVTVIQMQLIEFLLWRCQGSTGCSSVNAAATGAGIVINHLEPLVLYLMLIDRLPVPVHALAGLYTLMTIKYTASAFKQPLCTTVTHESAPHLHWRWNYQDGNGMYYVVFLLLAMTTSVYGLGGTLGTVHAGLLLLTFTFSKIVYGSKKSTGALWCFFAAFVPYVLLFYIN